MRDSFKREGYKCENSAAMLSRIFQIQLVGRNVKRLEGVGDAYSSVVIQCVLAAQIQLHDQNTQSHAVFQQI